MAYRVAVVGATGAVGREMLKTLAERRFPLKEVAAVASGRSAGQQVSFGEKDILRRQVNYHDGLSATTSGITSNLALSLQLGYQF